MPVSTQFSAAPGSRFALWRVLAWMLVLLAAFGVLEYSQGLWHVAQGLRSAELSGPARDGLERALWGNLAYLLVACVAVCLATATLLHRAWARPLLRALSWALAVWFVVTAGLWVVHWLDFRADRAAMATHGQLNAAVQQVLARVESRYVVGLMLKLAAALALAWLGWNLGRPQVRAQFPPARTSGRH